MAGRVYITSDLHIGHEAVAHLRGFRTTKEHDDAIIAQCAAVVPSKRDVLWILGDIAFGAHNIERLNEIPAIKKLVLGNHDHYDVTLYRAVANKVFGAIFIKQVLLTHIPVDASQKYRAKLNVHGHMHEKVLADPWYFNACIDRGGPYPLEYILSKAEEYDARP